MSLTRDIYHSTASRYITNSRIQDFLKCKRYFYELHIAGTRTRKEKEVFKVGQAVDTWLTMGKEEFRKKFLCVERRNLKNPPIGYTELTPVQFDEVVNMCEVLEQQPAFQELKDHDAQRIISLDMPINEHFVGLAGIPDWMGGDMKETCILTDLKTSTDTNERKHHYKCMDYGYYMQFAVMTTIIRATHGTKNFVYRHLVIDKDPDGVNIPYTYFLDPERIEIYVNILKNDIIPMIAAERDYAPKTVVWQGAPTVGRLDIEDGL